MTCEVCGSKKCKRQAAETALAERKAALEAAKKDSPFGAHKRLDGLVTRAVYSLAREERACRLAAFTRQHGGKCPMCLRPIAKDGSKPPAPGECGIYDKLSWSWYAVGDAGQSGCLALTWDRLTSEVRT